MIWGYHYFRKHPYVTKLLPEMLHWSCITKISTKSHWIIKQFTTFWSLFTCRLRSLPPSSVGREKSHLNKWIPRGFTEVSAGFHQGFSIQPLSHLTNLSTNCHEWADVRVGAFAYIYDVIYVYLIISRYICMYLYTHNISVSQDLCRWCCLNPVCSELV